MIIYILQKILTHSLASGSINGFMIINYDHLRLVLNLHKAHRIYERQADEWKPKGHAIGLTWTTRILKGAPCSLVPLRYLQLAFFILSSYPLLSKNTCFVSIDLRCIWRKPIKFLFFNKKIFIHRWYNIIFSSVDTSVKCNYILLFQQSHDLFDKNRFFWLFIV